MILGNEQKVRTPSGFRVDPMSYEKLEEIAKRLHHLLPKAPDAQGWRLDAWRVLEITLPSAGFNYRSEDIAVLKECAAFTIPDKRLVVLREDVYDGLQEEKVFSRSTVVHELSHIVLNHAVKIRREGSLGRHRFCEDSEWQANALTAAVMMPIEACRAAPSALDLAQMCGTSVQAATYRLERLIKGGLVPAKQSAPRLVSYSDGSLAGWRRKYRVRAPAVGYFARHVPHECRNDNKLAAATDPGELIQSALRLSVTHASTLALA